VPSRQDYGPTRSNSRNTEAAQETLRTRMFSGRFQGGRQARLHALPTRNAASSLPGWVSLHPREVLHRLGKQFVPFSMRRIRLMTRVELHKHPHSSPMRLPQNFFAPLVYLEEAAGQKAADILG